MTAAASAAATSAAIPAAAASAAAAAIFGSNYHCTQTIMSGHNRIKEPIPYTTLSYQVI